MFFDGGGTDVSMSTEEPKCLVFLCFVNRTVIHTYISFSKSRDKCLPK